MSTWNVLVEGIDHMWLKLEAPDENTARSMALDRASFGTDETRRTGEKSNPDAKVTQVLRTYPG